jgi:hypothetical protein
LEVDGLNFDLVVLTTAGNGGWLPPPELRGCHPVYSAAAAPFRSPSLLRPPTRRRSVAPPAPPCPAPAMCCCLAEWLLVASLLERWVGDLADSWGPRLDSHTAAAMRAR